MLPDLRVIDEPLLLRGRHLALLRIIFGAVKRTISGYPVSNLEFTFVGGDWESLAMTVVQNGAQATLIDCVIAAGEW